LQKEYLVFVGSYAEADEEGIYVFSLSEQGNLTKKHGVCGVLNPSYLSIHEKSKTLYAVSETGSGEVVSFSYDQPSDLPVELNRVSSAGDAPCYVSVAFDGTLVLSANYGSGNITVHKRQKTGEIGELLAEIRHTGQGIDKNRQDGAHAHMFIEGFESGLLFSTDLGTDSIYLYEWDEMSAQLKQLNEIQTKPSSGPRHLAFHPNLAIFYVVNELNSTVACYELDLDTKFAKRLQIVSTLPDEWNEQNTSADIQISAKGTHLYVSNRGHNTIVTYQIDTQGMLGKPVFTSSEGKNPRSFTIIEETPFMLITNQDSNSLTIMKLDDKGIPHFTGEKINIKQPVFVKAIRTL
jgi:6-phosphogluconolactonase